MTIGPVSISRPLARVPKKLVDFFDKNTLYFLEKRVISYRQDDSIRSESALGRRRVLDGLGRLLLVGLASGAPVVAAAQAPGAAPGAGPAPDGTSLEDALVHDPASPAAGNPKGDVTLVVFTDFNCPFCRRGEGDLGGLIAADPKLRVVYKDWPILARSSVTAAKVAIAANWQGKYDAARAALMHVIARPVTDAAIGQAMIAAGVDVTRLNHDLDKRDDEIVAIIKRTMAEADALGLRGTPVYIAGHLVEPRPLDQAGFRKLLADAREAGGQ
jgi:protein-disulfide isomerase